MDKENHGCVCGICGHHSYIECKNSNISTVACNKIIQEIEGIRY